MTDTTKIENSVYAASDPRHEKVRRTQTIFADEAFRLIPDRAEWFADEMSATCSGGGSYSDAIMDASTAARLVEVRDEMIDSIVRDLYESDPVRFDKIINDATGDDCFWVLR